MYKLSSFLLSTLISVALFGQNNQSAVFEDKEGKSSILLPSKYLGTNLSDESLETRFFLSKKSSFQDNIEVKKINGSAGLFSTWVEDEMHFEKVPKDKKTDTTYLQESITNKKIKSPKGNKGIIKYDVEITETRYTLDKRPTVETIITKRIITIERLYQKIAKGNKDSLIHLEKKIEEKSSKSYSKPGDPKKLPANSSVGNMPDKPISREIKIDDIHYILKTTLIEQDTVHKKKKTIKVCYKESRTKTITGVTSYYKDVANSLYGGFTLKSKANNGLSSIFDENDFTIGTSFDLHIGFKNLVFRNFERETISDNPLKPNETRKGYKKKINQSHSMQDWLTFSGGLTTNKFDIIDLSKKIDSQVVTKKFRGYNWALNYNVFYKDHWLFGLSGNMFQSNNASGLTSTKFKDEIKFTSGDTTRTILSETTTLLGGYKTFIEYNINADIIYFINSKRFETTFAFNPYYRTIVLKQKKPITRSGLGLYIIRPSNFKTFFGVFFEYDDIYNINSNRGKDIERLSIGITVKKEFGRKRTDKVN